MTGLRIKEPASTRYDPVIVQVTVGSQDHLFFRRPFKVAQEMAGGYGVPVAAVIVVEPSGLTATYRADLGALEAQQEPKRVTLAERTWAFDQLAIAFWFTMIPRTRRNWEKRDPEMVAAAFQGAMAEAVRVGLNAEQVAEAAAWGRHLALSQEDLPPALGGRTFVEFADQVGPMPGGMLI